MKDGKITIGVVSWYSTEQIRTLIQSLMKNNADPEKIEYLICDNSGGKDKELLREIGHLAKIIPFSPDFRNGKRRRGSYAHAAGLNYLLSQINTQYCLFTDPDVIVFYKNWDKLFKSLINECAITVGAPYHSRKIMKYHDFTSPIFTFFDVDAYKGMGVDWTPYNLSVITEVIDQIRRVAAIITCEIGEMKWGNTFYMSRISKSLRFLFGNSSKDVGWRIPSLARKQKFSASLLTSAQIPKQLEPSFQDFESTVGLMNEFELFLWQGIPFLTHFYSSRNRVRKNREDLYNKWISFSVEVSDLVSNYFGD